MGNNEQDWEFGIREEGHTSQDGHEGPIVLGENGFNSVSYTHLTLPTKRIV